MLFPSHDSYSKQPVTLALREVYEESFCPNTISAVHATGYSSDLEYGAFGGIAHKRMGGPLRDVQTVIVPVKRRHIILPFVLSPIFQNFPSVVDRALIMRIQNRARVSLKRIMARHSMVNMHDEWLPVQNVLRSGRVYLNRLPPAPGKVFNVIYLS